MIKCNIIADSISNNNRITSFIGVLPRIVLAELNTHRAFSRNSASSRAIPFDVMLDKIMTEPFVPLAWQKEHKGMQGTEYFEDDMSIESRKKNWLSARDYAAQSAIGLDYLGVTKQLCNRLLEPFMYHKVIITATDLENFFYLRCPQYDYGHSEADIATVTTFRSKKDATKVYPELAELKTIDWYKLNKGAGEIHIMAFAEAMWDAYNESIPKQLEAGEWHIPFGDNIDEDRLRKDLDVSELLFTKEECETLIHNTKIKIATARCARVSYDNYEGKDDYRADVKLFDRLSSMGHFSPFEHVAQAIDVFDHIRSGNFYGWTQLRKTLDNENRV